jgi:uncharacterized protein (TIGR02231 family)
MKPATLFTVLILLLNLTVQATEVKLDSKVNEVTVYHSGALVNRSATLKLPAGVTELVLENVSSKLLLSTIKINNKEITILNKSIVKKLTKEELNQLLDRKDVLHNQLALLELKYKEPAFVKDVPELEKMLAYYSSKIMEIKSDIRDVEKRLEESKKLEQIQLDNDNAAILKILVSLEKELDGSLGIQYLVGGIGWSPGYEIVVNELAENKIEVKYLARVMSQTGENWTDVKVKLSSSFPLDSPTELPKPDEPWTLSGKRQSYAYNPDNNELQQQQSVKSKGQQTEDIAQLQGVVYEEINIPSYLKLRTLKGLYSIKSNSTVFSFPILSVDLPATFYYYAFPAADPEAYLVAQVTGWDTIGFVDGIANVTFKNNEIGKSSIRFSEFTDTLLLPVGKDNSVFVSRKEIANQTFTKESNASKKVKDKIAFEYELRNNTPSPVELRLLDQVPISQTKSTEVDIEKLSGGNFNEELGEVTWQLTLEPGKTIKKELVFEIDSDARFYSAERKKFRAISAPKF